MERMLEKVRKRGREGREMEGVYGFKGKTKTDKDVIKKMAFVALNPLYLTILRLLDSYRVSMDPRSRQLLQFAALGVNEAIELLKSLKKFKHRVEGKVMEALEGEIKEAASKLEDALDSNVSDQFLLQSETESRQLVGNERQLKLYSLNLQGIEQDIDGFVQMVMKMEKLLNPWLQEEVEEATEDGDGEDEEEATEDGDAAAADDDDDDGGGEKSDILGSSVADHVTRSWFISWFATKAASTFFGMKEEYTQDLENLLPQEEDDNYTILFRIDRKTKFSRMVSEERFRKINGDLMVWWINKVAASIFVMERDALPEDDDDEVAAVVAVVSSGTESGVNMVGSTDLFREIRDDLLEDFEKFRIGIIVGMAGIGKTLLAKRIIQDPLISSKFEFCIFVRMGPESQWEETLQAIVAQMPDGDKMTVEDFVHETLKVRKCLIVLDDFWNRDPQNIFTGIFRRGISLRRSMEAAKNVLWYFSGSIYEVPFLNKKESWDLLRGKIFGDKRCPRELEKAGEMIAENCEGLPLLILTVAGLLSQVAQTPEYWSDVAANKTNSVFAYEQISNVVYPSYYNLPQHLKACFLYLAAFPQNVKSPSFRAYQLVDC